jgi:hypothetical protein
MEELLKLLSVVHQAVEVHLGFVTKHLAGVLYNNARFNDTPDKAGEFAKIVLHIVLFSCGKCIGIISHSARGRKEKSGEISPLVSVT